MPIVRWMARMFPASLLLVIALTPCELSLAAPAQASEGQNPGEKRVYTNDDFPVSEATPRTDDQDSAGPVTGPTGQRVAPFVVTPMEVVDRMLELAGTQSSDVVYDLGSGDGRIVLRAAEKFGAHAVGIELEHRLAVESAEKAKAMKLDDLVTIIEGDLFQTDLSTASVVTVYLLLSTNDRLRPVLEKQLKPGTRVVAHDMRIPGWKSAREEEIKVGQTIHYIYLYEMPGAYRALTAE